MLTGHDVSVTQEADSAFVDNLHQSASPGAGSATAFGTDDNRIAEITDNRSPDTDIICVATLYAYTLGVLCHNVFAQRLLMNHKDKLS